jgi:hypothetical protein
VFAQNESAAPIEVGINTGRKNTNGMFHVVLDGAPNDPSEAARRYFSGPYSVGSLENASTF